jgi:UDP-2,4-diacetamido-2,4,6-trideoxy-beta-L-altropyranose hydrolase
MVVRADASVAIGLGHAMRCLTLAAAAGEPAPMLMADPPEAITARTDAVAPLRAAPGTPADAAETIAFARARGADWAVVDGYHFDGDYQQALVDAGLRVLAFDDHGHAGRYAAHLVLNQNLGASEALYADRAPYTYLLLGLRYVLLRPEFRGAPRRDIAPRARRVLISLGGSDPDDVSTRVLTALERVPGPLEVQVLIGGANPHGASLERAAARSPHAVELVRDARDVAARMRWADLAVAAAGGSAWELASVGTPQVSVALADNQRPAAAALAQAELAVVLGWHAEATDAAIAEAVASLARDPERRARLSARGQELIDGRGAERVLAAMAAA